MSAPLLKLSPLSRKVGAAVWRPAPRSLTLGARHARVELWRSGPVDESVEKTLDDIFARRDHRRGERDRLTEERRGQGGLVGSFKRIREESIRPVLSEFGEALRRRGYIYLVEADPNIGLDSGPSIELRLEVNGGPPVTSPNAPGIKFDANRSRGVVVVSIRDRHGRTVGPTDYRVAELSPDTVRRETLRAIDLIFK